MSILMHLIHSNLPCLSNSQINSQKLQPATIASEENKNQQLIKTGLLFGNLSHYEPGNPEWSSVLIIARTRGRQSSQNFNPLLEVIYFCGFVFGSFFLTCITTTTWQSCFPYVCLQKIAIHRKCVADTWLQGAGNDSIDMVIMQQPSLRDTVCIPQSLQKATPKWQGFRMFLFIRSESNPLYIHLHTLYGRLNPQTIQRLWNKHNRRQEISWHCL